jgi:hypothetical protein
MEFGLPVLQLASVQLYLSLECRPAVKAYRWKAMKSNEGHHGSGLINN